MKKYLIGMCIFSWCTCLVCPMVTVTHVGDYGASEILRLPHIFAETNKKETANFIELHSLYLKWSSGLFGSRKYYRQKMYMHLMDLLDKYIKTGFDYYLESPEAVYDTRLRFVFYNGNWLYIEGEANKESIKKITGKNPEILLHWWRSRKLLSVSGKIRRYRIDDWDRKIHVFLDDMSVYELQQTRSVKDEK
ncbi:MAG TPA: hypothetical protein PLT75_00450 [Spirochaetota bacterium]|nr:hypothetical protein [Spirochaetota bacterium]